MFPSPSPSSETLFRVVYDSPIALAMTDASAGAPGKFVIVNDAFSQLVAYSEDELKQRTPLDITHPDDRELTAEYRRQLFAGEIGSYDVEKRFMTSKGEVRWVRLFVSLIRDDEGAPTY